MAYVKEAIIELLQRFPNGISEREIKEILNVKTKYISNSFKQLYYHNFIKINADGLCFYNEHEDEHLKNRDFLNNLKATFS